MTQIADFTGNTIKADAFNGAISGNVAATSVSVGTATITSGTGAPTASAPKGSLYLRTDGAAATTLYVNASGTTTWLAVTAA